MKRGGNKNTQICAAVLTAALFLLLLFFCYKVERARTLYNAQKAVEGEPLLFSEKSGFFTEGFILKIERDPAIPQEIEIHYTTDGDEPTSESPLYTDGIDLSRVFSSETGTDSGSGDRKEEQGEKEDSSDFPSIEESRKAWRKQKMKMASEEGVRAEPQEDGIRVIPVRACLIQGEDKSRVVTRTYVIGTGVFERFGAYVVCLATDSFNLFDYDRGIMIRGSHYQKDVDSGIPKSQSGNFYHEGEDWVKNGHVTLFSPGGEVLLEEDIGLSVAGQSSRILPTRSLRMEASVSRGTSDNYFHLGSFFEGSAYGTDDGKKEEEKLPDRTGQAREADSENFFQKIKIRTHGSPKNHIRCVRGEYAKILTDQCGFPGLSENRFGAAYLNGEFYTACDIAPSATRDYFCELFGLPVPDAFEMFEGNDYDVFTRAKILGLLNADLTKEENCSRLEEAVDMDNYLFYYALEVLLNNSDWPYNNFSMWRYLGEEDPDNPYTDGRFRFILDDMDQILTNGLHAKPKKWSSEVLDYMMKDENSTFHHTMDCKRYRDTFLTYLEDLLQTVFEPESACDLLDSLYAQLEKEYRTDYGDVYWTEMETIAEITKKNVREKEALLREDIEKYMGLTDRYQVRIEAGEGVRVSWNGDCSTSGSSPDKKIQSLEPGEAWAGEYYAGTAFTAEAAVQEGYRFVGWETVGGTGGESGLEAGSGSASILVSDALCQGGQKAADAGREGMQAVTLRAVAEPLW